LTPRARSIVPILLAAALFVPVRATAGSAGVAAVALWAGRFDALESDSTSEAGTEVRFVPVADGSISLKEGSRSVRWRISPALGVMRTSEDATCIYLSFRLDLPITGRFTLTPQFGAGHYHAGHDKVLGGHFHFRSGIEASYRLGRRQRLGLLLYHLSNAGIRTHNPGEESLAFQWAVSF
jgi:hypothetical protein